MHTHLVRGINRGIWLASHALVPKLLVTSHGWPREPLPEAPSYYATVSLSGAGFGWVVPYMINPPKVALGRVR